MALTFSNMMSLGTPAPHFELPDVNTDSYQSLQQLKGSNATLIFFICNHCPYVKHIASELRRMAEFYIAKGISFIAISANDINGFPEDAPDKMRELSYPFPYLYDESQEVAKKYDAACTPDFFLFDANLLLVYRGQLDDSRPSNQIPCDGKDLRKAIESVLHGEAISPAQRPSIGCNIKWKK